MRVLAGHATSGTTEKDLKAVIGDRHDRRSAGPLDLASVQVVAHLAATLPIDPRTTLIVGNTKGSNLAEGEAKAGLTPDVAFNPYELMRSLPNLSPYLIAKYCGIQGPAIQLSAGSSIDASGLLMAQALLGSGHSANVLVVSAHYDESEVAYASALLFGATAGDGRPFEVNGVTQVPEQTVDERDLLRRAADGVADGGHFALATISQGIPLTVEVAADAVAS